MSQVVSNNSGSFNSCVNGSNMSYGTPSPDISQCLVPPSSTMHYEIQRIATEALGTANFAYNYNLKNAVKNTMAPELAVQAQDLLQNLMQKVEQRLKDHLDEVTRIESDPLHEVRQRVTQFRLT